jgi:hypothetical protein
MHRGRSRSHDHPGSAELTYTLTRKDLQDYFDMGAFPEERHPQNRPATTGVSQGLRTLRIRQLNPVNPV